MSLTIDTDIRVEVYTGSKNGELRYMVVDAATGGVLDDAKGEGYQSPRRAKAAWKGKQRMSGRTNPELRNVVRAWKESHQNIAERLERILWNPARRFEGSRVQEVESIFASVGDTPPCAIRDLVKYWN